MKKQIFSIFLAIVMVLGMVPCISGTAAAADAVDPAVQEVYDAYTAVHSALAGNTLSELQAAAEGFEAVLGTYNGLSEEQMGELAALLEVDAETAFSMIFADWISTNVILEADSLYQAYLEDSNAGNAQAFVEYYDSIFNDPDYQDETMQELVRAFISDIDEVYEDAVSNLPSGDVAEVYNAYVALQYALESCDVSELQAAAEGFEAALEAYNNLSEEQMAELAALLGVDAETAFSMIFGDWINTNVVLEADSLYQAYLEDSNSETAQAFVEYYDSIFNNPDYQDEALQELVRAFIFDIDEVYEEAAADIDDSSEAGNPDTGDHDHLVMWIAVMLMSTAATALLIVESKKRSAAQ